MLLIGQLRWRGQGSWYNGCIKAVNEDGTYTVEYDDSDIEISVAATSIKRLPKINYAINTPIYARPLGGRRRMSARIIAVTADDKFDVLYSDGTKETGVHR